MLPSTSYLKPVLFIAVLLLMLLMWYALPLDQWWSQLQAWIKALGWWGPLVFMLIYIIATICLVPASALTLLGGAVFGLWLSFVLVSLASTTGAALAFLIARYVARDRIMQLAEHRPHFAAIDRAVAEGGWRIVVLLRLSPAIPFNLQNYIYGLTAIRFWPCVLASWLAMMPGTLMYVYLGHVAGEAATEGERSWLEWAMLGAGLIATIAVTVYISLLARRQLKRKLPENDL